MTAAMVEPEISAELAAELTPGCDFRGLINRPPEVCSSPATHVLRGWLSCSHGFAVLLCKPHVDLLVNPHVWWRCNCHACGPALRLDWDPL